MLPLLFILPVIWMLAYSRGRDSAEHRGVGPRERDANPFPWPTFASFEVASRSSKRLTAADYLKHLNEAAAAARAVDLVKHEALAADVASLMAAPDEVGHAVAVLGAPIEMLFVQKDLNVLGANPPVPENGTVGRDTERAIAAFQARFGQNPTGRLNSETAAALRYSVGCIYSQDRAFVV